MRFFPMMLILLLPFSFISIPLSAQIGEITGRISTEMSNEALAYVNVQIEGAGIIRSTLTNEAGIFYFKPLPAGTYRISASRFSQVKVVSEVKLHEGRTVSADIQFPAEIALPGIEVIAKKIEPLDPFAPPIEFMLDDEALERLPVANIVDAVSLSQGVTVMDGQVFIRGARSEATKYIVDEMSVGGTPGIPMMAIRSIEVLSGGIPAKYGDTMGGIIKITTKDYFSSLH